MRRTLAATAAIAALALGACSTPAEEGTSDAPADGTATDLSFDVSGVEKQEDIAALLPAGVADAGTLRIAAALNYAPAEFLADDLSTPIGYDVDLGKALAAVLGLESEVRNAEFASLLPTIGTTTDIGISSFTVTEERTAEYNMIGYITVGSSYAVQTGNPNGFDPENVCGTTIGVQTGTWQEEELAAFSEECESAGNGAIEILSYANQADVTTNLIGAKLDAFYADSTVADYAVKLTSEQIEVVGGVRDAAPQGIVVSQDDAELTEALQAAMQYLMDEGVWTEILAAWGISEDAALPTAELNPRS